MTIIKEYAVNFYSNKEKTAFDILEDYYNKILSSLEILMKSTKKT